MVEYFGEVSRMVNVVEDKRSWNITVTIEKEKCPFRYFPSNIIGCKFRGVDEDECILENCPLIS